MKVVFYCGDPVIVSVMELDRLHRMELCVSLVFLRSDGETYAANEKKAGSVVAHLTLNLESRPAHFFSRS